MHPGIIFSFSGPRYIVISDNIIHAWLCASGMNSMLFQSMKVILTSLTLSTETNIYNTYFCNKCYLLRVGFLQFFFFFGTHKLKAVYQKCGYLRTVLQLPRPAFLDLSCILLVA